MTTRVAVVGAGIAGLTAARALADAGLAVTVFDKSRGLGGRLATRRTDRGPIDHGAPGVPTEFGAWAGALSWPEGPPDAKIVATPGISSLVKPLAANLEVVLDCTVTALSRIAAQWQVLTGEARPSGLFDAVIVAIPAPQAATLLGVPLPGLAEEVLQARMDPLWTLILALPDGAGPSETGLRILSGPLALAIPQSAKPVATPPAGRWAIHADVAWSVAHVDLTKEDAAKLMWEAFRLQTGTSAAPLACVGHRWRLARVSRPLGRPFAASPCGTVLAGGDWALGPLATHAATSGRALADALLAARG